MLAYILYTLFILACFILILVVLLQPGKGDAASALGGGVSGAAFGPRGTTTLLAKVTIAAAVAFMAIAFSLSIPGLVINRSVTAGVAVPDAPAEVPAEPVTPAPTSDGSAPPAGATPAGQVTIDENGKLSTTPPADQKPPEAKSDAKPEAKPDAKTAPDTKKSGDQKK